MPGRWRSYLVGMGDAPGQHDLSQAPVACPICHQVHERCEFRAGSVYCVGADCGTRTIGSPRRSHHRRFPAQLLAPRLAAAVTFARTRPTLGRLSTSRWRTGTRSSPTTPTATVMTRQVLDHLASA